MSYQYVVMNDQPIYYLPLEELSGTVATELISSSNGTYSALPKSYQPLVSNALNSKLFATEILTGPTLDNIWNVNQVGKPFSVECWVTPSSVPGAVKIVGRGSQDGLTINSHGVTFSVQGTTSLVEAYAPIPDWSIPLHIVGIWDMEHVLLYINGQLSASQTFEDILGGAVDILRVNPSGNTGNSFIISQVALYDTILSSYQIDSHYQAGIENTFLTEFTRDVSNYFTFDDSSTDAFLFSNESTENDLLNAYIIDGLIWEDIGLVNTDQSVAGYRETMYDISEFGTIDGSKIYWGSNSTNFNVQISLDGGTTWVPATNNSTIPGLTRGSDATSKILLVKQNFLITAIPPDDIYGEGVYGDNMFSPDVQASDEAYLNSLRVVVYSNKNIYSNDVTLQATLHGDTTLQNDWTMPLVNNGGMQLSGSSYLSLPVPTDVSVYGIETLVKFNAALGTQTVATWSDGTGLTISAGTPVVTNATVYVNGVLKTPVASDFPINKWVHLMILPNISKSLAMTINATSTGTNVGNISMQVLGLYYDPVDLTRIVRHVQGAYGIPSFGVQDGLGVGLNGIAEQGHSIYKFDWAV